MDEKNRLSDEQMKEAAGGGSASAPEQKFNVGDKVMHLTHIEYGLGTVRHVYRVEEADSTSYKCAVLFENEQVIVDDQNEFWG